MIADYIITLLERNNLIQLRLNFRFSERKPHSFDTRILFISKANYTIEYLERTTSSVYKSFLVQKRSNKKRTIRFIQIELEFLSHFSSRYEQFPIKMRSHWVLSRGDTIDRSCWSVLWRFHFFLMKLKPLEAAALPWPRSRRRLSGMFLIQVALYLLERRPAVASMNRLERKILFQKRRPWRSWTIVMTNVLQMVFTSISHYGGLMMAFLFKWWNGSIWYTALAWLLVKQRPLQLPCLWRWADAIAVEERKRCSSCG